MTEQTMLAEAETEIWNALCDDPDHAAARVLEVIRRVEAAFERIDRAEHAAALGYFWYLLPGDGEERYREGTRWLRRALDLDDRNTLARLYLGHFEYDVRALDEAMAHLERIEPGYYSSRGQSWKDLKIREILLATALRQGCLEQTTLDAFIADYSAAAEEDRAEPSELVAAAADILPSGTQTNQAEHILRWVRMRDSDT